MSAAIPALAAHRNAHGVVIEGRAYRDGEVVCDRVQVTVRSDGRLGLTPRERRSVVARFLDRPRPQLRDELVAVVRRRGAAARRAAERMAPIEVVCDGQTIVAEVQPPLTPERGRELREVEFDLRER
jgi:hypothetical protein